jgi:putative glutamine amidotransferase
MKPLIGIAGNVLLNNADMNGLPITYTPQGFVNGVRQADAIPVVFPISDPIDAKDYLSKVDGLLLAGGQDVSPLLFGEEPSLKLGATNPARDAFEIALVKEAIHQAKPIFAVCRGLQLVNVAYGGTLYQDVSDYPDLAVQHVQLTHFETGAHTVDIEPDSTIGKIFGNQYVVNTYHHQAIKELAEPFRAVAWSKDGLIEAFEAKSPHQSIVAVQWHPELMIPYDLMMQRLFTDFVKRVIKKMI